MSDEIRLTRYSHGAGCGCKIAPATLSEILHSEIPAFQDANLLVGNESSDDAAVYALDDTTAVVSTTDFFMPIVDDPTDFGRIAVTNAMSDVYAMGGRPIMAIAVLGWPLDKLPATVARAVVEGGRRACADAGIALAGGHSIDAPEPIFGAAITGIVEIDRLKRNDTAVAGSRLYLTKPLGIGILTTAEKKGILAAEHAGVATELMCRPNRIGTALGRIPGVSAMTDVTGFGLLGHLLEMCRGSELHAELEFARVPRIQGIDDYIRAGAVPGGTGRNHASFEAWLEPLSHERKALLCDPQTSGGLLVAVRPEAEAEVLAVAGEHGLELEALGELTDPVPGAPVIRVT